MQFWRLIEESNRQAGGDPAKQAAILTRTLADHTINEIIEFETLLVDYLWRTHDMRLMAASAILDPEMDDDEFRDFGLWLISRGRSAYERSIEDPDTLVDFVHQDEQIMAPEIGGAARKAYHEKTGREDFYSLSSTPPSPELKNESFVWQTSDGYADVNRLRVLFPRLWEKFGSRFNRKRG